MVQNTLPLKNLYQGPVMLLEKADAVGLRCEDQVVTLRFMAGDANWGQAAKQIRLDRRLAEELSRLLANELEDYA